MFDGLFINVFRKKNTTGNLTQKVLYNFMPEAKFQRVMFDGGFDLRQITVTPAKQLFCRFVFGNQWVSCIITLQKKALRYEKRRISGNSRPHAPRDLKHAGA